MSHRDGHTGKGDLRERHVEMCVSKMQKKSGGFFFGR